MNHKSIIHKKYLNKETLEKVSFWKNKISVPEQKIQSSIINELDDLLNDIVNSIFKNDEEEDEIIK
jgi:hypothetical protein